MFCLVLPELKYGGEAEFNIKWHLRKDLLFEINVSICGTHISNVVECEPTVRKR
jgi:hypothetical protein